MKYLFLTTAIFLSVLNFTSATPLKKDSNVVISLAREEYSFAYNQKDKNVVINQKLSNTYKAVNFRDNILVSEFYDDKSIINKVDILVNEKKAKNIIPAYEYYQIDDVFYSDAHVCYFKLPLEKKDATSQVIFEKTINDPRYFTSVYFTDEYNIADKTIEVTIPKWMSVELKEYNFEGFNIKKTKTYNSDLNADVYTYTLKNIRARVSENASPGGSYTEPHLFVLCKTATTPDSKLTYFNTLDDLYGWYRSLTKDLGNNAGILKAKSEEITANATSEIDKIKAIFYWMQDNIRYVAFEDGIAGFKPAKADDVLRKKYGDCKGMAHLTKELLKAQGFDARLCWIGTNHIAYDYTTPSIAVDNHMICALIYKGKTYFLDATENYIGFNEYAERIQGRQVLIEDGDKYIYSKVPPTVYTQNLDIEKSTLTINGNAVEGNVTREWKGEEKENIFSSLNAIKKEKTNDAFINYLSNSNTDYSVSNFVTSSLNNYDAPLTVSYNMNHKNAISVFDKDLYLDIDFKKDLSNFIFDEKERVHDYWFSYKYNLQRNIDMAIPAGYSITAVPPNVFIKNDDYEIVATITKMPTKILYNKQIIIKNTKLKKQKFAQWNADVAKLNAFYNEQIVLTKK